MNKKVCKTVLNKFNSGLLELFIKNKIDFWGSLTKKGLIFKVFSIISGAYCLA